MATEQQFAEKFLTDEAFRSELKSDPKAALGAHGMDVPEGIDIKVVESTENTHYIVLPPLQTEELSDDQLTAAQGGTFAYTLLSCVLCA